MKGKEKEQTKINKWINQKSQAFLKAHHKGVEYGSFDDIVFSKEALSKQQGMPGVNGADTLQILSMY